MRTSQAGKLNGASLVRGKVTHIPVALIENRLDPLEWFPEGSEYTDGTRPSSPSVLMGLSRDAVWASVGGRSTTLYVSRKKCGECSGSWSDRDVKLWSVVNSV